MNRIPRVAVLALLLTAACRVSVEERINRGNLALASGKLDVAIEEFRKAVDTAPTNAAAHERLGTALRRSGALGPAETELRQAVSLDPASPAAEVALGDLLWDKGEREAAKACYQVFLGLPIDDPILAEAKARITVRLVAATRDERAKDLLGSAGE